MIVKKRITYQSSINLSKLYLQQMGKLQIAINLTYLVVFALVLRHITRQTDQKLFYRKSLLQIKDHFIANKTISPDQFPPQLKDADFIHINGTEAFVRIVQEGLSQIRQDSGLNLNNRLQAVSSGDLLTILLHEDPKSELLLNLHKEALNRKMAALPISVSEETEMCIFAHVEKQSTEESAKRLLESIMKQDYMKYNVIYVDDAAEGNSFLIARSFILGGQKEDIQKQYIFERNQQPQGLINNLHTFANQYCSKKSVVVVLDGSSFLASPYSLKMLNQWYAQKPSTTMVSGKTLNIPFFEIKEWRLPTSQLFTDFRKEKLNPFLHSFKFQLFTGVKDHVLTNPNTQKYFKTEAAAALYYALLETSGSSGFQSIPQILVGREVERMTKEREEHIDTIRGIIAGVGVS